MDSKELVKYDLIVLKHIARYIELGWEKIGPQFVNNKRKVQFMVKYDKTAGK